MNIDISISFYGQRHITISLWFAFIMNQKWISKIYKQEKVDGRIPILQLDSGAKSKSKINPDI